MRGNFITDRNGNKNPNYKHGLTNTRLFSIWNGMRTRCYNDNFPSYKWYGARGITVCDDWKNDFMNFYNWSINNGYQEHLTIDRIDVNGNYEPINCRWATIKEQSFNRRNNRLVIINGIENPLNKWCELFNINSKTVRDRLKRGWTYEKALSSPVQIKFRKKVM